MTRPRVGSSGPEAAGEHRQRDDGQQDQHRAVEHCLGNAVLHQEPEAEAGEAHRRRCERQQQGRSSRPTRYTAPSWVSLKTRNVPEIARTNSALGSPIA